MRNEILKRNKDHKFDFTKFLPDQMKKTFPSIDKDKFLVIPDEDLHKLPKDFIDCVTHLVADNYGKSDQHVIFFDDEETETFIDFSSQEQIHLLVFNPKYIFWVLLGTNDKKETIVMGGSKLREYLNDRNIYFWTKNTQTEENPLLISATNFKYIQEPNEDCSIPQEDKNES